MEGGRVGGKGRGGREEGKGGRREGKKRGRRGGRKEGRKRSVLFFCESLVFTLVCNRHMY